MTTNQLAYWANQEAIRANQARETENFRTNVAREQETRRANEANERLKDAANRIARQNKVDELEVRKLIETEANRLKQQSNLNQAQANAIAQKRVENDYNLGLTTNDIKQQQQNTNQMVGATQAELNTANKYLTTVNTATTGIRQGISLIDAIMPG